MLIPDSPLSEVKGIGPRFLYKFSRLGIETVGDLLRHFPSRYEDWTRVKPISQAQANEEIVIRGTIQDIGYKRAWRRHMAIIEAVISDSSGAIRAIWFNQPYLRNVLQKGRQAFFSGRVLVGKGDVYLSNPAYELIGRDQTEENNAPGLLPIYPETKGLTSKGIRLIIRKVLSQISPLPEFIPEEVLAALGLPKINQAFQNIHQPTSIREARLAKRRFEFEELFLLQLNNLLQKLRLLQEKAPTIPADIEFVKKILAKLPFELTQSQKRSLWEILKDLERPYPMNRLLQGDVGSGKTVVAAIAALVAAKAGYQSAFMAPTEVLANQHYETLKKFFGYLDYPICLLTAKSSAVFYGAGLETELKKQKLLEDIAQGKIKIIIGTHALIAQKKRRKETDPSFDNLGFVVIDEQHRFGVEQRAKLTRSKTTNKSESANKFINRPTDKSTDESTSNNKIVEKELSYKLECVDSDKFVVSNRYLPHFLSMSATPIPRTLAITVFGDLDLSIIDELPLGRKPVITKIVAPANRDKAYAFIRGQVRKGRQVFVICPRIEPTENMSGRTNEEQGLIAEDRRLTAWDEVRAVKAEYERLSKEVFPDLRVVMLHGRMKASEKNQIMADFKAHKYDILVSTSVIEVGVDVPNATIMLIEDADKFGLAQLYQFRGRVGRGEHQSFCFLFTKSSAKTTYERLKALLEAKNGFELAEKDLMIRGPGEFLGTEQAGLPDVAMKALTDAELVRKSREAAKRILEKDPTLNSYPALKKKMSVFQKEVHLE